MPGHAEAGPPAAGRRGRELPLLFLGSTFALGGAERVLAHLAHGLARPPFRVEIAALRDPGAVGLELRRAGLVVHSNLTGRARLDPFAIPRLRAIMKRGRFEAVYFLDHAHAVFHGVLASLDTQVRVRVMPVHTTGQWHGRRSIGRPIRLMMRRLDRIIAIAETQREYLIREEGIDPAKLVVIPNGVPLEQPDPATRRDRRAEARALLGVAEETPVIGITAVLRPEKNHELLLRAFARVRADVQDAELWIIGDGPRRAALEAEAARLGLPAAREQDRVLPGESRSVARSRVAVRFLGRRSDARLLMAGFDIAVLSSHPRVETLPLSLIEAMDAGVPVVSTRVGALAELIEEERSGLLVAPGDEAALCASLQRLCRDSAARRSFGARGQAIARERYAVEIMVESTRRLLLELLGENGVSG